MVRAAVNAMSWYRAWLRARGEQSHAGPSPPLQRACRDAQRARRRVAARATCGGGFWRACAAFSGLPCVVLCVSSSEQPPVVKPGRVPPVLRGPGRPGAGKILSGVRRNQVACGVYVTEPAAVRAPYVPTNPRQVNPRLCRTGFGRRFHRDRLRPRQRAGLARSGGRSGRADEQRYRGFGVHPLDQVGVEPGLR
jgi:hypothetical protein